MKYLRACICLVLATAVSGLLHGQIVRGQAKKNLETLAPAAAPDSTQEVSLLLSGATIQERILLTLNNNRPTSLKVDATVFDSSGQATKLAISDLQGSESRVLELSPLLLKSGVGFRPLGYLQLKYVGKFLGLGAQLTLYPDPSGPGVDSPRSLTADFKASARDAVFWLPSKSQAKLAFTNTSESLISVQANCGWLREKIFLAGHETAVRSLIARTPVDGTSIGCSIDSTGGVSDLRVAGTITSPYGYAAPIRFYDASTSTSSSLTAVGLDTDSETVGVVRNLQREAVTLKAVLREVGTDSPLQFESSPINVRGGEDKRIDLDGVLRHAKKAGVERATLTIEGDAKQGGLIGALDQMSRIDHLTEDIPLRTGNPAAFARGIYPLRWSQDYTNRVMVANSADRPHSVFGFVTTSAGVYVLPKVRLEPGATTFYDVDRLRKEQVPDFGGHKIPLSDQSGKIFWQDADGGRKAGLIGRNSVTSIANHRRSSFSCGGGCSNEYSLFPHIPVGFPILMRPAEQMTLPLQTQYMSPYGYLFDMPNTFSTYNPFSTGNSDILEVGADPASSTNFKLTGQAGGNTTLNYTQFFGSGNYYPAEQYCDPYTVETPEEQPVYVRVPTQTLGGTPGPPDEIYSVPLPNAGSTQACPSGYAGWDRMVKRYIVDQNYQTIVDSMFWAEDVVLQQNPLNITGINTGNVSTTDGTYHDQLAFCSQACPSSTASSYAVQHSYVVWQSGVYTLYDNQFRYSCTGNYINGQ